jgi:hypothetical protein
MGVKHRVKTLEHHVEAVLELGAYLVEKEAYVCIASAFLHASFCWTLAALLAAHLPAVDCLVLTPDPYEGEFRKGLRHGRGSFSWTDGATYEGDWEVDLRHGHGTHVYADGRMYEGDWRAGDYHGRGTLIQPDGTCEVGEWEEGLHIAPTKLLS